MAEDREEPRGAEPADGESDASSAEAIEAGRLLFAQDCQFVWAAATLDQLPEEGLPEVAFAGRSNVGKSSLVNALTGRKTLARTSNTPGRTQQIIFFDLGNRMMLVDLPGIGYAKVSKSQSRAWNELIRTYLRGRVLLKRLCLLVDARHGLKDVDRELMTLLDGSAVGYQLVLTKADKVKGAARERMIAATADEARRHVAAHPAIITTSAQSGEGIPELRAHLAALA